MQEFNFNDFWEDSAYATNKYIGEFPSEELIDSVEKELGYKLPAFYVEMMKLQNGGIPKNTCFPTKESTSWANDHVAITGILGIGRDKTYSLCGGLGSQFMIDEWGYPDIGICICNCPSAGHDMIMLDYRKNGWDGEPEVVHVDQESDYRITFLAENFESFIKGLVHADVYDTSVEDLKETLEELKTGSYSDLLKELLQNEEGLDRQLRNLLIKLTEKKGYFALHADELSHLVYDVQFYLYSKHKKVSSKEEYLKEYPQMIAFGNNEITTNGYAPGFVEDWINLRMENQEIKKKLFGGFKFEKEYEAKVINELKRHD
ncbi:SMI1/KNR4 family protein [Fulvivirga ulvae]|uniref:SMI1/KNR4 family protein n=1 Tax=Fulvivirga ulvae TaxID=2904245 RepID=UPI001F339B5C|nr:SMI1/KNR4 family protein [Fulvivirga ulvae]UII31253.1 SMI1/KNR4 family protein [Fulvivirga ulvae]